MTRYSGIGHRLPVPTQHARIGTVRSPLKRAHLAGQAGARVSGAQGFEGRGGSSCVGGGARVSGRPSASAPYSHHQETSDSDAHGNLLCEVVNCEDHSFERFDGVSWKHGAHNAPALGSKLNAVWLGNAILGIDSDLFERHQLSIHVPTSIVDDDLHWQPASFQPGQAAAEATLFALDQQVGPVML